MADPMTQSHQISSSQGLNDGHCKDSKCSDSFFSSSPVSLIQSPQDKRVALDSDKPSEGVATSLRFSSQPSSFSPVTYGNESSGTSSGIKSRSFQEKLELFESSLASQKQDSSPIKVSPVSERIKALEALAAKKSDSDWSDGGIPHFKERHYEKSPTEGHGISYRSSVKKKPTPTEQDSPESPFEILGDARRGSDFEDTADWMRAHLPPAPNFNIDEADFDEAKQSSVMPESPCKEAKSDATEAPAIPESFVGVPDEFMDTPTEVTSEINDDPIQSKQDSIEDESEFDLQFLPTAYMWDKQEKADMDAQEPPGFSETHEVAAAPAPPAGFESSALASPTPVTQVDMSAKEQTDTLGGSKEPAEILEVDSSGESDDTVIEDMNGLGGHATGTDTLECKPSTNKETPSHDQVKPVIQVPIINVIETEEQVFSDYEVEHEEEMEEEQDKDDDEQNYQIKQEPTREDSQSIEDHSEPLKSMPEETFPTTEDISSRDILIDSGSPEDKLIKDNASEHTFTETSLERPGPEDLQAQSAVSLNAAETFPEYAVNAVETDETAEVISDLPPNYDDLSNEAESSDIDTYLDHYSNEELALHDQLNSDVFTETDSEAGELPLSDSHQHDQNSTIFAQQLYEETVDEVAESLQESKMSYNTLPETSSTAVPTDDHMEEHLASQNKIESLETEEQIVVVEDQKAIEASSSFSLMEEEHHVMEPAAILSSIQEGTLAPFPSFHNDLSSDITEDITDFDVTKEVVETSSEQGEAIQCDGSDRKESPELVNKPEINETESPAAEATDSFVEFMRECLKLQQDEESKSAGQTRKEPISVTPSPPAIVMDLVQEEHLTISALNELESTKEEDDETNICNKNNSMSSKDEASQQKSESTDSLPTAQYLPNEYQSDASLTREVEAIDIWVAEAYHLAEHVLAVILTHLSVQDLVYWRDPKKSGIVFGTSLLLLLSLAAFSVISVISYLLLALLCVTISFRVYKSVIQAVQKTNDGHPFKELMEKDVSLPPETFRKNVDVCLTYINRGLKQLSRLFLVEDLVDSLKLAVVMWLLTYVGAVFNGITVLILVDILAFTVPPLYEKYKTQIDHYVGIAHTHLKNVVTKIQEKLPKSAKRNKTE